MTLARAPRPGSESVHTAGDLTMPDQPETLQDPGSEEKKRRKKAEKARKHWLTFIGRVVAQVVGAAASVGLGLLVIQRYQQAAQPAAVVDAGPTRPAAPARPRRPGPVTIAVLPLANLSGDPDREYFADGLTEALTASLARLDRVRVISRTSAMRYKTSPPPIPEIAEALGADLLVEGSVLQDGTTVRITAQLIDGRTDEHLWAERYTRPLRDIIALQDEVASAIATAIEGSVASRRPAHARATDPATYDLYMRGRHAWYTRTPEGLRTALGFFQKAVDRDPDFALAHVGMADTYALQGSPGAGLAERRNDFARARAAAIRALDLDSSLAEAHTALGGVIFFGDRDLRDAEAKFRRAIELNPSYPVAHEWLGLVLAEQRRFEEALEHANLAVALDPLEATMYQARGFVEYQARRYAEAVASERRALELTPTLPLARALLVKALLLGGQRAEAWDVCADTAPGDNLDFEVACIVTAAMTGRPTDSAMRRSRLEAARPTPDAALAQIDAALGRLPEALARLRRLAAVDNLPPALAFDPLFDALRSHDRWPELASGLGPPR
jgi:TolB-like protein/Flp pilus assembly protein TadD